MKEIPILFSTPMVQAILDGRKTMTRRTRGLEETNQDPDKNLLVGKYHILTDSRFEAIFNDPKTDEKIESKCYYGLPGDILWVRETARICDDGLFAYKADYSEEILNNKLNNGIWKPSIHMPKAAARIWLQVEEIKVERLHEITEEDAIAEGIISYYDKMVSGTRFTHQSGLLSNSFTAKEEFEKLWKKINGNDWNIGWDLNPWVWVVKFKVLSTSGKTEIITL